MASRPNFPSSPYTILDPDIRWFPDAMEKLMPPLVDNLRREVKKFRDSGYVGATQTSRSLLNWWFNEDHSQLQSDGTMAEFRYFFAQREALETIIYLYDVVGVKNKYDMMRFDSSGEVSGKFFDETWRRFVIKMATGTGKTKVMSLALAWSFFHKLYEPNSELSRNFLVITPNIIVLDRIYRDFDDLRIFFDDPVLPDNGYDDRNWTEDFQLELHKQDDVHIINPTGNIFLTNIHRIYSGEDIPPSPADKNTTDYFLGRRPTGATTESKTDLGMIVRDIDELMILNDEAHHIHDEKLAWFKAIQDIHNGLLQRDCALSLQLDVTATPKHEDGRIFVQTVADYPLVEAIFQNVVKLPVLPDSPSRKKLKEHTSAKYTERYVDYLKLGVIEWRKVRDMHEKLGKKAILFVMTDDTRNCDDVAEYLENFHSDLKGAVLVIHTKNNGEISEAVSGKAKEELVKLRGLANNIDSMDNPYKAIVSVMMLKEGWDVRNVTTIVGLRPFGSKSKILPEQTLGRGLRRMYPDQNFDEKVSVIGTETFMEFVESIEHEGVKFDREEMGERAKQKSPLLIEVDFDDEKKDIDALDIEIPNLTPRIYREYEGLADLDPGALVHQRIIYQDFSEDEQRKIVFKPITTQETDHITILDWTVTSDYRNVISFFARSVMNGMHLRGCYDVIYGKIKEFVQTELFDREIDFESINTIRNLSEPAVVKTIIDIFRNSINPLTIRDKGDAEIYDNIKLKETRPFMVKYQKCILPVKSVFNRIVGDFGFELTFANFLENCSDVISHGKNYLDVGFKLDYVNPKGNISNYRPDFIVKLSDDHAVVVETKGREDLDVPHKMTRLRQWCEDVNRAQSKVRWDFVYVDQDGFERFKPSTFGALMKMFREYQDE